MRDSVTAYVSLGANLGAAQAAVLQAFHRLDAIPRTRVAARSTLYRTVPQHAEGPDFINAVARVETRLDAMELFACLQELENQAGRDRPYPNAPRTLDLDLLLYGEGRIDSRTLTVPHPRIRDRAFVLVPLAEVAPHLVAPHELDAVAAQGVTRLP
jgi:2-amino-4-hydroxy-6-hydroxymethyldihydropteridine diphosphokinase